MLTGCVSSVRPETTAAPGTPVTVAPGSVPRLEHVVIVIFENRDRSEVIGSSDAPYLTSLAREGADFIDSHAEVHPSQPNYIALLAGELLGVKDNDCPYDLGDKPNLVRQLLVANISVAGYFEGMPSPGYKGCESSDGRYVRKHNPFPDFSNIPDSANLPFGQFPDDPADLPTVAFVVPDLCNDMHSCPVQAGDDWMKANLSEYASWAKTHNSLLIVTFDEDSGSSDENLIPTIFYGDKVAPGAKSQRINHYNILRTIEEMYGLTPLGNAASAEPVTDWKR